MIVSYGNVSSLMKYTIVRSVVTPSVTLAGTESLSSQNETHETATSMKLGIYLQQFTVK